MLSPDGTTYGWSGRWIAEIHRTLGLRCRQLRLHSFSHWPDWRWRFIWFQSEILVVRNLEAVRRYR